MASRDLLLLSVARLRFLSTNEKLMLARKLEDERDFLALRPAAVESIIERSLSTPSFDPWESLRLAEGDRKRLTAGQIQYTFYEDTGYPPQLREIHNPPFLLFIRGKLPDYELPMLGIVGTRHPTGRAARAAFRLGYEAGQCGIAVASGLARGIDAFAHKGNIAGGGQTVAVLGCGIDSVYPSENRQLARGILESGGGIVSEYPPGELPLRYHFPERNRIISGLCRGIVVGEAPWKSGALITADYALEQGRDLYVHRAGICGDNGAGALHLADDGARVVEGIDEILADWGYEGRGSHFVEEANPANIASLMRAELRGEMVLHHGQYFRRIRNG